MMGFFSNLFAKQNCAVCGKECGTLHRSKLRDGQFLCDDCGNKCSKYIRLSELTLDEAKEHMEYMARMKRVFDEVFDKTEFRVNAYPSTPTQMGLVFCDELGMLYIDDRTGGRGKMPELIRYDQIASYEEYLDETPAKEPGQEPTLNGGGLKLKLVQPRSITEAQTQRGMRPHPYIKQELVICFSKRDRREIGYAHIARQHLDHIFGVHDNETSMFGRRMSKAEERELKGQVGMISAMGAVASAAMKGGQLSEEEKARFVENINLANDAQTGGMAVYSRRADEAFAGVLYLGSVPERTTDVHAVLDSLPEQPWQFVADIPADRWVTAPGGGRELYCIFAVRREDTLFVYEKQDPQYPHQTGRELYCRQGGQPILLLCNGSPDVPDITAVVYCTTGRALDWSPQFSAGTGSPEPVEGVDDFSQHPTPGAAP